MPRPRKEARLMKAMAQVSAECVGLMDLMPRAIEALVAAGRREIADLLSAQANRLKKAIGKQDDETAKLFREE